MARVFIVNMPLDYNTGRFIHDVRPAQEYGTIVHLTPSGDERLVRFGRMGDALQCDLSTMVREMWRRLEDFNEDEDYVLPVGAPIYISFVGMVLGLMGISRVRFLLWRRESNRYMPATMEVPNDLLADVVQEPA
jgi:hypothetical protein